MILKDAYFRYTNLFFDNTCDCAVVTESSPDIVKRALYELLQKGLKGVFRRDAVATALGEATLLHPEMPSVVVDVLALVDTETTTMGGSTKEERDRCGHLIIFFCLLYILFWGRK